MSANGAKFISNAGLAGAVYPATATLAHNGYVAGGDHFYPGTAAAAGYYGVGSKVIAGNGIYSNNGLYTNGLHAHGGLLAATSGLRSAIDKIYFSNVFFFFFSTCSIQKVFVFWWNLTDSMTHYKF